MKIMIVDDNAAMREMIRDTACSAKDKVMECADSIEAVTSYSHFQLDYEKPSEGFSQ